MEIWSLGGWTNPRIIEATFYLKTGGVITKREAPLPTTGWAKKSGYGSVFEVSYTPSGTILACSCLKYTTGSNYMVGRIYYDDVNLKLIAAPAANITTLAQFNTWLSNQINPALVEDCAISEMWSNNVSLPSGSGILSAAVGKRYTANDEDYVQISATVTGSNTLINPTPFASKPLIRLYGNGTVSVNGITITVVNSTSYVDIDCDMMDCYEGSTNRNNDVTFSTHDFPVLEPGENTFTIVSGVSGIRVTPRWWQV